MEDTPIYGGGKRERAPVREVKVSDIPAQSLGKISLDENRERAPVMGVKDSDDPSTLLDAILGGGAMDTSGTLSGGRERAP